MSIDSDVSISPLECATPAKDLRTAVWHGDVRFSLRFPVDWQITALWPATPPPLSEVEIAERLNQPSGQPPVSDLCRGKKRPLVIVDDMLRPTPAGRILPHLLRQFEQAGIAPGAVRILVAAGTHGAPRPEALIKKLGPAAADCEVLIHAPGQPLADAGTTTRGIRIRVNREMLRSDFIIGIGGIYPNRVSGFCGGSKLALGVLGAGTVRELCRLHPGASLGSGGQDDFHAHLDEIAGKIGLCSMISLQVDADRNIVRLACGDPSVYYPAEVVAAQKVFGAPLPDDADVVISNAYPGDISLASVEMRGLAPLHHCGPEASRIVLGSCAEGMGPEELLPSRLPAWLGRWKRPFEILRRSGFSEFVRAIVKPGRALTGYRHRIWLYRPGEQAAGDSALSLPGADLPSSIGEIQRADSWQQVLDAVRKEQSGKPFLRVYLYPCAPLQCFTGVSRRLP